MIVFSQGFNQPINMSSVNDVVKKNDGHCLGL